MACMYPPPHMACMYPPPLMACMYPPPLMACMYPPPLMACMYPPPHMIARILLLLWHACILLLIRKVGDGDGGAQTSYDMHVSSSSYDCMYPPLHKEGRRWRRRRTDVPPPLMTCMYPPPHMICMYPPPHIICMYPPPLRSAMATEGHRRSSSNAARCIWRYKDISLQI